MIHHAAFLKLGDSAQCSAQTCQRAILLFGTFDLSLPRLLIPQELDVRFGWPLGSAQKTLNWLDDNNILVSLAHGRHSAGGQTMWVISQEFTWTPRSLADQWDRELLQEERSQVARQIEP